MRIIEWNSLIQNPGMIKGPVSLSIGVFDGLHAGHRVIVKRVVEIPALPGIIITFRESPRKLMASQTFHGDIFTLRQKLDGLSDCGVSAVILIDFSFEFSRIGAKAFFESLAIALTVKRLVVGEFFYFGRKREGGIGFLKENAGEFGYSLDLVPPVFYANERISSTRIRQEITAGNISTAAEMLGRPYALDLREVPLTRDSQESGDEKGIVIVRKNLGQILPEAGNFSGILSCSGKKYDSRITISNNELCIKPYDKLAEKEIETLSFIREERKGEMNGNHQRPQT
ncbi:MAG: FAD synthetase family protein [Spirochaetaceae bacterium]|nr:MAG: FAD synthetase family protein [Spirochaetaceae bacterium]